VGSFFQARVKLLLHSQASGKIFLFWRGTKLWRWRASWGQPR